MSDANWVIRAETAADRVRVAQMIARTYQAIGALVIEKTGKLREKPTYSADLALIGEMDDKAASFALFTPVLVNKSPEKGVVMAPFAVDERLEPDVISFFDGCTKSLENQDIKLVFALGTAEGLKPFGFEKADKFGYSLKKAPQEPNLTLLVRLLDDSAKGGEVELPDEIL